MTCFCTRTTFAAPQTGCGTARIASIICDSENRFPKRLVKVSPNVERQRRIEMAVDAVSIVVVVGEVICASAHKSPTRCVNVTANMFECCPKLASNPHSDYSICVCGGHRRQSKVNLNSIQERPPREGRFDEPSALTRCMCRPNPYRGRSIGFALQSRINAHARSNNRH